MFKEKVQSVSILTLALFLSACNQTQPQVDKVAKNKEKVTTSVALEVNGQKQQINLTKLSLSSNNIPNQEEKLVSLKVKDEIEWNAKELLRHKYVWSPTGPNSYDCTGLTKKVFGDVGIFNFLTKRHKLNLKKLQEFFKY